MDFLASEHTLEHRTIVRPVAAWEPGLEALNFIPEHLLGESRKVLGREDCKIVKCCRSVRSPVCGFQLPPQAESSCRKATRFHDVVKEQFSKWTDTDVDNE